LCQLKSVKNFAGSFSFKEISLSGFTSTGAAVSVSLTSTSGAETSTAGVLFQPFV
jgi:hypothetical protein